MKKTLVSLLLVICFAFCLTACNDLSGEYWKSTYTSMQEIFESEEFLNAYNVDFNANLDTLMASDFGEEYAELKVVLAPLFTSSISYVYKTYTDLQITPKNTDNAFKDTIKALNSNLQSFKSKLSRFTEKKDTYESYMDFVDQQTAQSDTERARLLLFKREYIDLINMAYNLSNSMFNARKVGYHNFSDYKKEDLVLTDSVADASLAVNLTNLEITNCAIKIVKAYNAKELASNYKNYIDYAVGFYNEVVVKLNNNTLTVKEDAKTALGNWQDVNNLFVTESKRFYNNLNKINLDLLTEAGNNAEAYALLTEKEQDEVYAEYYLNFYKNIATLKQYSLAIFN